MPKYEVKAVSPTAGDGTEILLAEGGVVENNGSAVVVEMSEEAYKGYKEDPAFQIKKVSGSKEAINEPEGGEEK